MRNKLLNNKKGFTLVELIIVIAIIAILMVVIVPTAGTLMTRARRTSATSRCNAMYQELLIATTDGAGTDIADITADDFTNITVRIDTQAPTTSSNDVNYLIVPGDGSWQIRCYYGNDENQYMYMNSAGDNALQVRDADND